MGDVDINEEISYLPSTSQQTGFVSSEFYPYGRHENENNDMVCCDDVGTTSFLSEQFAYLTFVDDIFVRLLTLTSCVNRCFIQFIEDLVFRDVDRCLPDLEVSSCEQHSSCSCGCSFPVPYGSSSSSCEPSDAGTSPPVCQRNMNLKDNIPVYRGPEITDSNHSCGGVPFIFQGLKLPLFGLRLAWRLTYACWRYFLFNLRRTQNRIRSVISRVKKTLHGSSDDIGWLQQTQGLPPVEDGTSRFMELLHCIRCSTGYDLINSFFISFVLLLLLRNGEHILPNSFVYLLIPGLFSNLSPLYFVSTKRFFSKMGLACHIAKIHSEAAVEHNARELKQYIEELYWGSGKRVMLLGHSKGGVDAAAALSLYWPDLKNKVAGLALVQSPYGGTPIASDILREGQIADKETRRIMELLVCKLIKGDMRALDDLTYEKRKDFITKHRLPAEHIPLVSFRSEASVAPGVLATMSHIAHAELPWLPFSSLENEESDVIQAARKVPVVIPISAAMAISALHLQLRYGEKSDGLVTCRDAEVPGSVVVRPERKLDHAWMVYSSWKQDLSEPDACEMCEALLTLLVEIGKGKKQE